MNSQHRYAMAAWCVGCLLLTATLWAQEADILRSKGVPQDWSDHSIVFTLDGLAQHPELIYQEPRILHQLMQRFQARGKNVVPEVESEAVSAGAKVHHRDWSYALGKGHVSADMYPAKWTFDPSAPPSCANDYVVFGLATAGAALGQANLVAFNNLYAGAGGLCTTGPSVYFAYDVTTVTGGKVATSPVISLDGTKIAFVESLGTASIFHVLTFTPGQGGVLSAATPTAMTSLTYSSSNTTSSSPWIDYASDIVYVADDNGVLNKITGVFEGTPTLVTSSPWPITVSSGSRLGPPVLDKSRGLLLAGGRNGDLYEIDTSSGAVSVVIVGSHGAPGGGVVPPPIVDVTNGTTFAVSGNDGTSAVLVQADTVTLTQLAKARIGVGGTSGTTINIYQPALSNDYYTSPSSGAIYVCGTGTGTDTSPWAYSFGFTGRTMLTTAASTNHLVTSAAATCTSWTEFFNPNTGANGTDFFFFGLTAGCPGGGSTGCAASLTTTSPTLTTVPIGGGPSGIIVDNYSTAGQASSIYFTGEAIDTAYKFTQNGLN
ncbi:MAG: hypothetical protein WAU58_07790 [Terriglobales bacterium]